MYKFLIIVAVVAMAAIISTPTQAITLATSGKTNYVIVTPAKPVITEVTAAKELQEHLLAITGANFPIKSEASVGKSKKLILVGQTNITKKLLPKTDWKSFGSDGTLIVTKGDTIILSGGRARGGMYAVFTFLEDVLGCHWWSHNESFIPRKPNLKIDKLNMKYVPKILCREAHYFEPNNYGQYSARNKLTGHFNNVPIEYGGHYTILGFCHTFFQLIPPEKYFAQHPEWFSMINGKRKAEGAQLCLANEEMRKELVKNALELIKTNPAAGIISIAQNDWLGQCQCPECKAVEDAEGSPSGPVIKFVNKVAEDIEKQYPDFLVETLAYQYTRKAPKNIKPRDNVLIRLCSIECDYGLTMNDPDPKSKAFKQDLDEWAAISKNMYIWTYIARFGNYLYPNPSLPVYEPNIRLFEKNKVVGVFMQGDAYNEGACFVRLRSWVIAHLLWNPALDQATLVKEFMDGYYGPASPYLTSYLKLIEEAYAKKESKSWMTPKYIVEGRKLFDQAAKAVADNPELLNRVTRERIPLDYLLIMNYDIVKSWAAENNTEFYGPGDLPSTIADFEAAVTKHNVGYISEGGALAPRLNSWKLQFGKVAIPPVELGDLTGKKTVDMQESKITLYAEGTWVNMKEDPEASNNMACVMNGTGTNWAVQIPVDGQSVGKWHCYASVKIDAIQKSGDAFMVGIYDTDAAIGVVEKTISIEEMNGGKYKLIDLGVHTLNLNHYFWFSPADNPKGVKTISVDRVLLVAE